MNAKKRLNVAFNPDEQELFSKLKLSRTFSKFVKAAFYDKIDAVNSGKEAQ